MNREQKENTIKDLRQNFLENKASFLINYKGLAVSDLHKLRKQLRGCGAKLKIAKDRLIKIAINDTSSKELSPYLKQQIAVVFVEKDASAAAKTINDFAKDSQLDFIAGVVDSNLFDKAKIIRLASLPSREVLLAQLCGLLNATVSKLARTLVAVSEKKSEGSKKVEASEEVKEEVKAQEQVSVEEKSEAPESTKESNEAPENVEDNKE